VADRSLITPAWFGSEVGGLPPGAWAFSRRPAEKPRIHGPVGFGLLSLSHTRGLVAAAVSDAVELGIDVEAHDPRHDAVGIAESYFRPEETRLVQTGDDVRRRETFLRLWTLKEAFVKATGERLGRRLQSFGFQLDPLSLSFVEDAPSGTRSGDSTRSDRPRRTASPSPRGDRPGRSCVSTCNPLSST
jgi:4'-phosphopantetheinyl transferase